MKIALYIEDGLEQIILTPENPIERDLLGKLSDTDRTLSIKQGQFAECVGGWMRQGIGVPSTMIVLRPGIEQVARIPVAAGPWMQVGTFEPEPDALYLVKGTMFFSVKEGRAIDADNVVAARIDQASARNEAHS